MSNAFPAAAAYTEIASGLLAISISRNSADFVLWFRPELVRTVTWAGDPQRPVTVSPHGTQLNPRASFAAWHTEIRQQATPWDPGEIGVANSFRLLFLETIFQQLDLIQQERAVAFDRQRILIAELNHRVKNTLANIQAMIFQTEGGANTLNNFTKSLQLRIRAMAHAHDLIAATHWAGASFRQLLAKELSPFQSTENNQFTICGDEFLLSKDAALPFTMVVHELITNAAKYGALSTTAGHIEIDWQQVDAKSPLVFTWTEQNGPVVTGQTHRGFGSMVIERSLQHEIQGHSILRFEPEGVVCILTIPPTHLVRNANDGGDS